MHLRMDRSITLSNRVQGAHTRTSKEEGKDKERMCLLHVVSKTKMQIINRTSHRHTTNNTRFVQMYTKSSGNIQHEFGRL